MRLAVYGLLWAAIASCATAFIVPEELVSFLSIVYSNIPPIRKGTDSRVGVGFRLGPHADAQIVLELGPQTNTRPIGPNAADSRKRHTPHDPYLNTLDTNSATASGSSTGGDWLKAWRTSIAHRLPVVEAALTAPAVVDNNFADPTKLSGEPLVLHLRKLYRTDKTTTGATPTIRPSGSTSRVPSAPKKSTRPKPSPNKNKGDLSDVSLDD